MRRLNPVIAILVALIASLSALLAAAPAMASSASTTIYRECESSSGQLTGHFTRAQLQAALNGLPSEVSEYSDCQDLIQQALLRVSSHGGNGSGPKAHIAGANTGRNGGGKGPSGGKPGSKGTSGKNGGSAGNGSGSAVTLAGSVIHPGSTAGGTSSSLPVALVVVLILLALTAVSGGAVAIRRRVVARHST